MPPSLSVGDSGELISAASLLGIPHPPGYPLYSILGKLFSFIPFGSIAFKINLMTSFFGAAAATLLIPTTSRIIVSAGKGRRLAALKTITIEQNDPNQEEVYPLAAASFLPPLALAASHTFISNSLTAEVYTLNAFFVSLLLLIASLDFKSISCNKQFCLLFFLLGLGLGNHHTLLLIAPALAILLFQAIRNTNTSRLLVMGLLTIFFFILGFSVYIYLPLRSSQQPLLDWANPQTFENFLYSIMREGYASGDFSRSTSTFINQIKTIDLLGEFGLTGSITGLFGLFWLIRSRSKFLLALPALFLSFSILIVLLAGDFDGELENLLPFYIPAYLVFSMVTGLGLLQIYDILIFLTGKSIPLALPIILFLTLLSPIRKSLPFDVKEDFLAIDYGTNKLNSLDDGALYFAKTDTDGFSIWYLQMVERYREDVEMIPVYFLGEKWYTNEAMKYAGEKIYNGHYDFRNQKKAFVDAIIRNNFQIRSVYSGFSDDEFIPHQIIKSSHGITYRLSPDTIPTKEQPWKFYRTRGLEPITHRTGFLRKGVLEDYAAAYYNLGLDWFLKGELANARIFFADALAITPNDPDTLNNLAAIDAETGTNLDGAALHAIKAVEMYTKEEKIANARDTLAWIYYKQNKLDMALRELLKAELFLQSNSSYQFHRGMVEFKLNHFDQAKKYLREAINHLGNSEKADAQKTLTLIDNINRP